MNPHAKRKLIEFLEEDIRYGDIATSVLPDLFGEGEIIAKEQGVIAGTEEAKYMYDYLGCETEVYKSDGQQVKKGDRILTVFGPMKKILEGERTVLNLLMRMCGIATQARKMAEKARKVNKKARVVETRKTAPGLRYFDKKAVRTGTGSNHRWALDDCIIIKDNHQKAFDMKKIVSLVKEADWVHKIEVEVHNPEEIIEAARTGADIIMLDNFTEEEIKKADALLRKKDLRNTLIVEASGNITEKNIEKYAKYADVVSVGALTHSLKALDMSMHMKNPG